MNTEEPEFGVARYDSLPSSNVDELFHDLDRQASQSDEEDEWDDAPTEKNDLEAERELSSMHSGVPSPTISITSQPVVHHSRDNDSSASSTISMYTGSADFFRLPKKDYEHFLNSSENLKSGFAQVASGFTLHQERHLSGSISDSQLRDLESLHPCPQWFRQLPQIKRHEITSRIPPDATEIPEELREDIRVDFNLLPKDVDKFFEWWSFAKHHTEAQQKPAASENDFQIVDGNTGQQIAWNDVDTMMEELTTMDDINRMQKEKEKYQPIHVKIRRPGLDTGFENLIQVQSFQVCEGELVVAKFSQHSNLLATAGQDCQLKIWTVCGSSTDKNRWRSGKNSSAKPTPGIVINQLPYKTYSGHMEPIHDLSWNQHDFILTASLDNQVIMWHPMQDGPLRTFKHPEQVTGVCFHSMDTNLFVSCCSNNARTNMWKVEPKGPLAFMDAGRTYCTAVTISPSGKYIVVGLDNGECIFYEISLSRKNLGAMTFLEKVVCYSHKKRAARITGIIYDDLNSENDHGANYIIVTTIDSKMRVYKTETFQMIGKYIGAHNDDPSHHIKAHIHRSGEKDEDSYIICGSESTSARIWKLDHEQTSTSKFFKQKKEHYKVENHLSWNAHNDCPVTVTQFGPPRSCKLVEKWHKTSLNQKRRVKHVIITGSGAGELKVYIDVHSDDPFVNSTSSSNFSEGYN